MNLADNFLKLKKIIETLRAPDGCPWDRKQTLEDVLNYTKDELKELEEATQEKDFIGMREELGDLFLELVFFAQICEEKNYFLLEESLQEVNEKLIRRHPHIFKNKENISSAQVVANWEEIKRKEKEMPRHFIKTTAFLKDSFSYAEIVQRKAASLGFDWDSVEGVIDKVKEEVEELKEEIVNSSSHEKLEEELGDVLFSLVNVSRFLNIPLDRALSKSVDKFVKRFSQIEDLIKEEGKALSSLSFEEMDKLWDRVKVKENSKKSE